MECLIGMAFDDFVMIAADQTNARYESITIFYDCLLTSCSGPSW